MLISLQNELYDDGLMFYEYGPRTQARITLVQRYLDVVNTEMQNSAFTRRMFVQLFAEPGVCRNRETQEWFTGTALHALTLHGFNRYLYLSLNQQVLSALEQRYQSKPRREDAEVFFMGGNCNDLARGVVSETEFYISARRPKARTDTLSLGARILHPVPAAITCCISPSDTLLRWETVAALSRLPYVNLIIHYPITALMQQMGEAHPQRSETDVDGFFGGKPWRDFYRRGMGQQRHTQLISYFCERLRSLGFTEVVTEDDLRLFPTPGDTQSSNYFLIFAHKQPKGETFWETVLSEE